MQKLSSLLLTVTLGTLATLMVTAPTASASIAITASGIFVSNPMITPEPTTALLLGLGLTALGLGRRRSA